MGGLVLYIVIGIIVNTFISHLVGINGKNREIGYFTSFIVSFLFSPIIGLLLVLTSKEIQESEKLIEQHKVQLRKVSLTENLVATIVFIIILSILFLIVS
jgi:hypothetical protein